MRIRFTPKSPAGETCGITVGIFQGYVRSANREFIPPQRSPNLVSDRRVKQLLRESHGFTQVLEVLPVGDGLPHVRTRQQSGGFYSRT